MTGQASARPSARATASRSASVVRGTMRSTIEHGNVHSAAIQRASPASTCSAKASTMPRSRWPLAGRLSSDMSVSGPRRAARRRCKPHAR